MSKKNAAQLFGRKARMPGPANVSVEWKLPDQYVGLELEIEQNKQTVWPEHFWPNWEQTRDGSLRNGREYVLAMPLKGDALSKAIANIYYGSNWERSTTGSSHIHLDMMEEETTIEVIKVLTLMIYSLEDAVFRYLGVGREWCGFTNKLSSAPDSLIATVLTATIDNDYRDFYSMCHDNGQIGRYYGLNLMALAKHNSVEFRYFPTATTQDELIEWIQLVMSFKKAAVEVATLENLVTIFSNEDAYYRFITTYFAEWSDKFFAAVPQYRAIAMVKKAMAIAETRKVPTEEWTFKPEAITAGVMSRFITSTEPVMPELTFIMPEFGARAPECSECVPNTVMLYQGEYYTTNGRHWVPYHDTLYDGSIQDRRLLRHAMLSNPVTPTQLRAIGYANTSATYAVQRRENAIQQLEATMGISSSRQEDTVQYVPAPAWHPDEDEDDEYYDDESDDLVETSSWARAAPPTPAPRASIPVNNARLIRPVREFEDVLRRYTENSIWNVASDLAQQAAPSMDNDGGTE